MRSVIFLFLLISLVNATLSKSAGSKTKEKKATKAEKPVQIKQDDNLRSTILNTNKEFDTSESKRDFVKIGYVTPWNGHGYDVAKWTTEKYTHIAPVWFQFEPAELDGELTCNFKGSHDIDRGWLKDLRKNNSEIKIVPRFLVEVSQNAADLFQKFLTSESMQLKCIDSMADFLLRNQFDGVVLEFWLQILVATRGEALNYLLEMTELFGRRLRANDLEFIMPLTPPIQNVNPTGHSFIPDYAIPRIMEAVDYLNIMTYDFSGTDAEGDSPIQWIINNAQAFIISSRELSTKIVIGLNYYGRCKGSINDVILGNRFLELLNNPEYKLFWDDITHEHYLKSESTKCFYPTLRSIEDRLDLVEEMRLGGVGIWELGQGLNHFTSVL